MEPLEFSINLPAMLTELGIRDLVLIDSADLVIGPGLTVLTGETGAGKSVMLGALALALGGRADGALVRRGAERATATASFELPREHPARSWLAEKGLAEGAPESVLLRRAVGTDGRSRAFINDQPAAVGGLRELGALLLEIHGQHQAVGLLDPRTHGGLLDGYGGLEGARVACAAAWVRWREAANRAETLDLERTRTVAETEEIIERLAELDRLAPRPGEDVDLASERRLLTAAGKALADLAFARDQLSDEGVIARIAQAGRAVGRASDLIGRDQSENENDAAMRVVGGLSAASQAIDRALSESIEAAAALDAVAQTFDVQPDRLDRVEERLFALRALARKLGVEPDGLADERARLAERLLALEGDDETRAQARAASILARRTYLDETETLSRMRRAAGERLETAVNAELEPLKLGKARFRVGVEPLEESRAGPNGLDRVAFEFATLANAAFAPLERIASGGELARLALAIKAALAERDAESPRLMIFDEVDQGVGGAVADAIGQRLARLAKGGQVIVVTHSPQVAARAHTHWRVTRERRGGEDLARIEVLAGVRREEEIARMLAGATITEAARAAARALIHA